MRTVARHSTRSGPVGHTVDSETRRAPHRSCMGCTETNLAPHSCRGKRGWVQNPVYENQFIHYDSDNASKVQLQAPGSGLIRRLVAEDARQIVRRVLRNLRQARPKLALALMVRQKHVRSRDSLPDRRQRRLGVERSAAAVRFHAEIAP